MEGCKWLTGIWPFPPPFRMLLTDSFSPRNFPYGLPSQQESCPLGHAPLTPYRLGYAGFKATW